MLKLRAFNSETKRWRWVNAPSIITFKFAAEDIASRWDDVDYVACMEMPGIPIGALISTFVETENTLDEDVNSNGNGPFAFTPGQSSFDVYNGSPDQGAVHAEQLDGMFAISYQPQTLPVGSLYALKSGASLYAVFSNGSGNPPTTGSVTIRVFLIG